MSKRLLWALVLMGLTAVVLVVNGGHGGASVNAFGLALKADSSLIYLVFTMIGVVVGVLLK